MNTDDYEGHTPGPWKLAEGDQYDDDWPWLDIVAENGYEIQECVGFSDAKPGPDVRLMVDAPLLLAEVKRLRGMLRDCHDLLSDCGYAFIDGRWVDTENMEEEE